MSDPKQLLKEREGYVESITRFLNSHRAGTIDELRVCFDLTQQHRRYINRWIEIALMKKVKRLELDFEPCRLNHWRDSENYLFGWKFFSSTEIKFLTSLCLKHVVVTGRILKSFLSNCPLLETLHVSHSKELFHISVCGSSLRLKHLHISFCNCIQSIEVYAPNLVSFEYGGDENIALHINLKHVPQLRDVSYAGQWDQCVKLASRTSIPSFLPTFQLVNVTLQLPPVLRDVSPYQPEFPNLRYLTCEVRNCRLPNLPIQSTNELLNLIKLTERMPLLHKLKVEVEVMEAELLCQVEDFKRAICVAFNFNALKEKKLMMLREVEILGFVGAVADTTLVSFLILNAPNLDSIAINRCLPRWYREGPVDERKIEEVEQGRLFAQDVFSEEFRPKGAKFLLL
ncbi:hypothetical protein V6N12_075620 [Hibiscus sabdariffa]|uniref:At1g61320/AtMIF1 LRR domain-containing protein n=1 Tax=Hibiscus sabdariffa TaxID=183260 RepID=A0ABR2C849_9ROSI